MSPTFETVLEQASVLSAADRKRLAKILGKTNNRADTVKNVTDDNAVLSALRARIDEMERTENPKPNSSAKIAELIRKGNDRGYTL